ncbi:molybdate ABC transporter substrate-binding protein [Peteryoungia algae]|uniref:Molybdate ABC transporter substrate-binding protein n=1 Tax=Peteryoungia algae TaxID=2919917 RepID=A0ABT0CWX1_9HYPH|nr:molybdate ABC transporter substrate-binding protein [Rhizobium sp. SSM4.3]MCJ8237658.1 molybdate ABC transporter substrate-binding protein [Rhizobium sp. SSM4.3]
MTRPLKTSILALMMLTLCLSGAIVSGARAEEPVTVFAAASLKESLEEISEAWRSDTGEDIRFSFAASSALARQIEQGAPADIFLSADLRWMDYLDEAGMIRTDTRMDLLGNQIVLVAPRDATITTKIAPDFPLAALLGGGRLAMANVAAVPAGTYGKAALESLGLWDSLKDRIAQAENVRAALLLVSRGEAPLGIVYETDAKVDPGVRILDRFPEESHPAIVYPAALTTDGQNPRAADFLAYLQGSDARAIFTAAGFTVLAKTN